MPYDQNEAPGVRDAAAVAPSRRGCRVLGMRVDELDYDAVLARVRRWAERGESRYVCISTVHMVMESRDDRRFGSVVEGADLVGADGVPVIWASRRLGLDRQGRVFAPELTVRLCAMAAARGIPVGFHGSTPEVIADLVRSLRARFPTLDVAYAHSPPFRPLTPEEDDRIVGEINRSGARILFVGLGCPKQERWMNEHRGRVAATMLGVGWAFDVVSGRSKTAHPLIQRIGMEWFYRLVLDPRKLWRRHLKHNPRFVALILWQLLASSGSRGDHGHVRRPGAR